MNTASPIENLLYFIKNNKIFQIKVFKTKDFKMNNRKTNTY